VMRCALQLVRDDGCASAGRRGRRQLAAAGAARTCTS
jgi:hypothetical protein